ncbi:hypothetical protein AX15_002009 [Amanita polypyramis BW_CC]|nr:hypothetical protein AX15_002009 [Amanita polypyramis BW_CC]
MAQLTHPRVLRWLEANYPKPQVDPDWLSDCAEWLWDDQKLSPDANFQTFITALEHQLLSSDLRDSMLRGAGLPCNIARSNTNTVLTGPPILVEIAAMMEIAHSAFNLEQVRVAREERLRSGHATQNDDADEGDIDVDEGPPPKYPRGTLRLELTDGTTSLPAIEYRPLPNIILDVTPLGCKILLKNTKIRNGIAWLEPETVVMKGFSTKDREVNQKLDFACGLRVRMGLPLAQPTQGTAPAAATIRSPLRDISPPPPPELPRNDDEVLENRKRRVPSTSMTLTNSHTAPIQVENRLIASSSRVASAIAHDSSTSPYFPPSTQSEIRNTQTGRPLFAQGSIIEITQDEPVSVSASQRNSQNNPPRSGHQEVIPRITETVPKLNGRPGDTKGKGKAKGKAEALDIADEGDEFDENDFFIDQELLESLEHAEMEALQSVRTEATSMLLSSRLGSLPSYNNTAHTPAIRDVIEIADDDCEDKENIPVATRHVRRRTDTAIGSSDFGRGLASQPAPSGDIIDLSDSD